MAHNPTAMVCVNAACSPIHAVNTHASAALICDMVHVPECQTSSSERLPRKMLFRRRRSSSPSLFLSSLTPAAFRMLHSRRPSGVRCSTSSLWMMQSSPLPAASSGACTARVCGSLLRWLHYNGVRAGRPSPPRPLCCPTPRHHLRRLHIRVVPPCADAQDFRRYPPLPLCRGRERRKETHRHVIATFNVDEECALDAVQTIIRTHCPVNVLACIFVFEMAREQPAFDDDLFLFVTRNSDAPLRSLRHRDAHHCFAEIGAPREMNLRRSGVLPIEPRRCEGVSLQPSRPRPRTARTDSATSFHRENIADV